MAESSLLLSTQKSNHWDFYFESIPQTRFLVTRVVLPGIQLATAQLPTSPHTVPIPGSGATLDPLQITFLVDSKALNWEELWLWTMALSGMQPDVRQTWLASHEKEKDTAYLALRDNDNRQTLLFTFFEAFPSGVDMIDLETGNSQDVSTSARFEYAYYTLERIPHDS